MDYLLYKILCVKFSLLKLGVPLDIINYFCLSIIQIHTVFYFNYIIYFALLIFCCQIVATYISFILQIQYVSKTDICLNNTSHSILFRNVRVNSLTL